MNQLSISQQYLLCSLNKKGKTPVFNKEFHGCLIAAGFLDLLFAKKIAMDEKKQVTVLENLNQEYLHPIFDYIEENQPVDFDQVAGHYAMHMTGKRFKDYAVAIADSLEEYGYVTTEPGGEVLQKATHYIPNQEQVNAVIYHMRNEILGKDNVTDEVIALACLFDQSFEIKHYFAPFETEQLKYRIKEIRETKFAKIIKRLVNDMDDSCFLVFASAD